MKQILSTIILIGMAVSIFVWKEFDRINQKDYQLQQIAEHKLKEKQELDQVDALRQKDIESKSKHRQRRWQRGHSLHIIYGQFLW